MRRTTISLPPELAEVLEREARRRETSVSEVARTALAEHLGLSGDRPRRLSFAGVGGSGRRHTARNAEELLADGFGQDRGS